MDPVHTQNDKMTAYLPMQRTQSTRPSKDHDLAVFDRLVTHSAHLLRFGFSRVVQSLSHLSFWWKCTQSRRASEQALEACDGGTDVSQHRTGCSWILGRWGLGWTNLEGNDVTDAAITLQYYWPANV